MRTEYWNEDILSKIELVQGYILIALCEDYLSSTYKVFFSEDLEDIASFINGGLSKINTDERVSLKDLEYSLENNTCLDLKEDTLAQVDFRLDDIRELHIKTTELLCANGKYFHLTHTELDKAECLNNTYFV